MTEINDHFHHFFPLEYACAHDWTELGIVRQITRGNKEAIVAVEKEFLKIEKMAFHLLIVGFIQRKATIRRTTSSILAIFKEVED